MPNFKRLDLPGHCYFVTAVTWERRPYFADPALAEVVIGNLKFYRDRGDLLLHGYVVMPDHVHLLLTPVRGTISDVIRNLKSFTSKEIRELLGSGGPVWQARFYDTVVRDERHFAEILDYTHGNPMKAQIVDSMEEFEFSSYRAYAGLGEPLLAIDLPDGSRLGP